VGEFAIHMILFFERKKKQKGMLLPFLKGFKINEVMSKPNDSKKGFFLKASGTRKYPF